MLNNGGEARQHKLVWDFDWSDCIGTTGYNLSVIGPNARIPLIDAMVDESSYRYHSEGFVIEANRLGWTGRVRARFGDKWSGWSEARTFDVEALNPRAWGANALT